MIEMVEVIRHPNGEQDLTCPALVCDVCRKTVERTGNVEWRREVESGRTSPLYASHKEECSRSLKAALDRKYPGWLTQWRPAEQFLEQLANNFASPVAEIDGTSEVRVQQNGARS